MRRDADCNSDTDSHRDADAHCISDADDHRDANLYSQSDEHHACYSNGPGYSDARATVG